MARCSTLAVVFLTVVPASGADLADFAEFQRCLGPEPDVLCRMMFDCDNVDGRIDLEDYITFYARFTGQDVPPCGMVAVSDGEFEMGDPWGEGYSDELPVHRVYLGDYAIDRYEVTNEHYAAALNRAISQGGLITVLNGVVYQYGSRGRCPYCDTYAHDNDSRIHWDGAVFSVTPGKEDHPMVEVSWYGAAAYCNWRSEMEGRPRCYDLSAWTCDFGAAGYRLPTEAEWAKAAGWDPDQGLHLRFGEHTDGCGCDCLDGGRANYFNSGDPFESGDYPWTTPRGFFNGELHRRVDFGWPGSGSLESYQSQNAESYFGCYDMSGNVWEWCNDWFGVEYYATSPYHDPPGPESGTYRMLRGGSWNSDPGDCRSAFRGWYTSDSRTSSYGFRCAAGAR